MTRLLMMVALGTGLGYADPVATAGSVAPSPATLVSSASSFSSKFALPAPLGVNSPRVAASDMDMTSVPEPGSALLLGTGLLAVSFGARRMARKR